MLKTLINLATVICFTLATPAYGETCVKVRNGKDGYDCMKFSIKERQNASKYGLKLGTPYKISKQKLIKHGWNLDWGWLKDNFPEPPSKDGLYCGNGYDAVCQTAFRKNNMTLFLLLSGTNDGVPLISVDKEPF
jgi:hypothetical protein